MKPIQKRISLASALLTLSLGAFAQSSTPAPAIYTIDPAATKVTEKASELKIQPREEQSIHSAEIDKKNKTATISVKDEKGIIKTKEVYELKQENK